MLNQDHEEKYMLIKSTQPNMKLTTFCLSSKPFNVNGLVCKKGCQVGFFFTKLVLINSKTRFPALFIKKYEFPHLGCPSWPKIWSLGRKSGPWAENLSISWPRPKLCPLRAENIKYQFYRRHAKFSVPN